MGGLLFYLVLPVLFFCELCFVGSWSPHLVLLAFCASLVCDAPSLPRRVYLLLFGAASALAHNMVVAYTVAGMLACMLMWHFFQNVFTRDRLTQSLVVGVFICGLLVLGGDFSWTARFLIANIIIVPAMVWLWCGV
jgi:hypothetical protein